MRRFAFFLAQDTFDHTGTLLKSLLYMVMYYSFAQPRAVIWQMYLCTVAIVYACTGTAYLMSQVSAGYTPPLSWVPPPPTVPKHVFTLLPVAIALPGSKTVLWAAVNVELMMKAQCMTQFAGLMLSLLLYAT